MQLMRDSMQQVRPPLERIPEVVAALTDAGVAGKVFDNMAQATFIRQHGMCTDGTVAKKSDIGWCLA